MDLDGPLQKMNVDVVLDYTATTKWTTMQKEKLPSPVIFVQNPFQLWTLPAQVVTQNFPHSVD